MYETLHEIKASKSSNSGKYLTFDLSAESYGINILKIREIIGMMLITEIPQVPDFAKGVINLRNKVIPVLDLRMKFGMDTGEYDHRTCIIIVEISNQDFPHCNDVKNCNKPDCPAYNQQDRQCWKISGTFCRNEIQGTFHNKIEACRKCNYYIDIHDKLGMIPVGLIVDTVSNVINVTEDDIEETPQFGVRLSTEYILGMAKMDDGVKILLDVEKVLTVSEANIIKKAA